MLLTSQIAAHDTANGMGSVLLPFAEMCPSTVVSH